MRIPSGTTDQYKCTKCHIKKPLSQFGKDKSQARGHKYACKKCVNAARRGRYQNENRQYHLKAKYGLTPERYEEIKQQQQGLCAICQQSPSQRSGGRRAMASTKLFVDHDHIDNQVRGLLCHQCNVAIGLFNDDPTRLKRAAEYLRGMPVEYIGVKRCG